MHRLNTLLIHAGEPEPRLSGAVSMPIHQSVNYESVNDAAYDRITYIRLNNTPNHEVLHAKLAALEGTEAALVTASGMAAISAALLGVLHQGDHLLSSSCLYGGTYSLITEDLPAWGITHDFVDASHPESWEAAVKSNTRVFYVESLSNPLQGVPELEEIIRFCKQHGLLAVIDSTLTSPVNFRPHELGFDLIVHSATKYLNGHSDIAAGVVLGDKPHIRMIRHRLNHLGGCLDPNSCFLLHRGLKTLALRVQRQNETALQLATWLQAQEAVERVYYAGLPEHPGHERAKKWFSGFGGVLSFELPGSLTATQGFVNRLRLPLQAPSLGGVESLVTRPAATSHVGMTAEQRAAAGIRDGLVRFSVGLEDFEDLRQDFEQALYSQLLA
ncbi:MAG: aminotransferase class I/II-fold pyridoxal phosphate-dependent enzyme [Candidatus Eremiobacteraeota bacterium]|nr:aminotransferase class I/II-fold pyridoxal phosphate-dependent enzyme [Candidatus Eremiobacteraeota bacterium]MCW5867165.1 aminotransferase class I/II-fold pyridoxal phosphate-dependent enzyme [Candidatus Eremiobacteraeota bacterium]